ncbi:MAG: PH domain-containing protein [Candidatus Nanoarchaeia archaeon]
MENKSNSINEQDYQAKERPMIIKPTLLIQFLSLGVGLITLTILGIVGLFIASVYLTTTQILAGLGAIAGIFGIALFGGIVGIVGNIIRVLVTEYKITSDNEIIISRNFLSKQSQTYRIDQITSIEKKQSFTQRLLGVSSIEINIFGLSSFQPTQGSNQQAIYPILENIKEADTIFQRITTDMNADQKQHVVYQQQPKITPNIVSLTFLIIITLLTFVSAIITYQPNNVIISAIFAGVTVLFTIFSLSASISIFKLKKTHYNLLPTNLHITHNYFFSKSHKVVPYSKITNTTNIRNIFSYAIFKLFNIQVFTGGSKDPILVKIPITSNLPIILSSVVKSSHNQLSQSRVQTIIQSAPQPLMTLKPSISFILPIYISFLKYSLFFIVAYIISSNYAPEEIHQFITVAIIIGVILGLLSIITRHILKHNYTYQLFEDKIILIGGLTTISTHEIYTKNFKYISYHQSLLQRMFNEGSVLIYTAGESGMNGILRNIPHSELYYQHIEYALIYDSKNSLHTLAQKENS